MKSVFLVFEQELNDNYDDNITTVDQEVVAVFSSQELADKFIELKNVVKVDNGYTRHGDFFYDVHGTAFTTVNNCMFQVVGAPAIYPWFHTDPEPFLVKEMPLDVGIAEDL